MAEEREIREDRPLASAKSYQDLKALVLAEQLGYDVSEWNTEGILDVISDVEDLMSGESDKRGRGRFVDKEKALKDILDRLPNDGDLGIMKKKLTEFAGLETEK